MPRYSRLGAYDEFTPDLSQVDYDVDDVLGQVQTLPRGNYKAGIILQSLVVSDRSSLAPGLDIFIFDEAPAAVLDNEPFAWTAGNLAKCLGVVKVCRANYRANVAALRRVELGIKAKSDNVYAVPILTRALLVPFDTDALTFRYHFELERV